MLVLMKYLLGCVCVCVRIIAWIYGWQEQFTVSFGFSGTRVHLPVNVTDKEPGKTQTYENTHIHTHEDTHMQVDLVA